MDFFSAQDAARGRTTRLVVLFLLALLGLIVLTNLLVMAFMGYLDVQMDGLNAVLPSGEYGHSTGGGVALFFEQFRWERFLLVGAGVVLVVTAGSLYKIVSLRGGGRVVAESLGGRRVSQDSDDPLQRKVLNVVEEMAIASGTPVPPVYVLEREPGINAFAAGFSPADAVIGVTRGCIEQLSRDQLQGVIAHEFSHILNGDMRLNLHLTGVLHGILLIGLIGYFVLRSAFSTGSRRGGSRSSGGIPLLALGAGLAVIGYIGTFFGNLIKASVSRQREFLADASAVQFTRNPAGIAGALKRIGGFAAGSRLESPLAPQMSHAYFSAGVETLFSALFATHPPLAERIRRIEPRWRGEFDGAGTPAPNLAPRPAGAAALAGGGSASPAAAVTAAAIGDIGQPRQKHLDYAESLIDELPAAVRWAAREPYGARAVIYALVLDSDREVLQRQLALLDARADIGIHDQSKLLLPQIRGLERKYRLILVDMAMPAMRQLSGGQYERFKENLRELIRMDRKVTLFEWSLQKIVVHNLDAEFLERRSPRAAYGAAAELREECALVFSVLAYAQRAGSGSAARAFAAARAELGIEGIEPVERRGIKLDALDRAMERLARLKPLAKPPLLKACAAGILANGDVSPKELELLRAFSSILGCPMPPVVV